MRTRCGRDYLGNLLNLDSSERSDRNLGMFEFHTMSKLGTVVVPCISAAEAVKLLGTARADERTTTSFVTDSIGRLIPDIKMEAFAQAESKGPANDNRKPGY